MKRVRRQPARIVLTSLVIGFVIVCTGCSFVIGFNIRNVSDLPITVKYSLKDSGDGSSPRLVRQNDEDEIEYLPFPEDRISIDTQNRVVEFKLLPSENAQLYRVSDRLDNKYEEEFNLAKLSITVADGSTSFEGGHLFRQFRPIKKSWFAFGPEIMGFVLEYR